MQVDTKYKKASKAKEGETILSHQRSHPYLNDIYAENDKEKEKQESPPSWLMHKQARKIEVNMNQIEMPTWDQYNPLLFQDLH